MEEPLVASTADWRWWVHDRFGLFIHWGLYALPARHEWVKHHERMSDEAYQTYFDHFDPDLYDPRAWARAAQDAGMRYVVITSKHHEGFCLWDSTYTDYKATNTPCGKDLLKPAVEAFRDEGLRVGFYHSLIDWHHPEFPVDRMHPMRDNAEFRQGAQGRDIRTYQGYLQAQVRELLTGFGPIDVLFFDFSYPGEDGKGRADWQSEALLKMVREQQPQALVNDRLDLLDVPGGWDYRTPEQVTLREGLRAPDGRPVLWETCQTFSGSWGYHRDETSWKSVEQLVQLLIDTVSKGGNLLLNVGPTGRGEFDHRALERLSGIGQWMRRHGRSIYGCTEAPPGLRTPQDGRLTYNPDTKRLYVHVFNWPIQALHLEGLAGQVTYAHLLHDASEVRFSEHPEGLTHWGSGAGDVLTLELPVQRPEVAVPVIELFLKQVV